MELTLQTESITMYAFRKLREGFTLVELIIVMVILGILAAVAVPKMGTVISKSGTAAAAAVIAQLESAAEIKALDNVILNGNKDYPDTPAEVFNQLEKKPDNYHGGQVFDGTEPNAEGAWWYTSTKVYHIRNGIIYNWTYESDTGELTSNNNN